MSDDEIGYDDQYFDSHEDMVQDRVGQAMNGTFAMTKGYGRFRGEVNLYAHPDNPDEYVVVAVDTEDGRRIDIVEISTAWLHDEDPDAEPLWFPLLGELSEER